MVLAFFKLAAIVEGAYARYLGRDAAPPDVGAQQLHKVGWDGVVRSRGRRDAKAAFLPGGAIVGPGPSGAGGRGHDLGPPSR